MRFLADYCIFFYGSVDPGNPSMRFLVYLEFETVPPSGQASSLFEIANSFENGIRQNEFVLCVVGSFLFADFLWISVYYDAVYARRRGKEFSSVYSNIVLGK
ncbi:hypothetical protein L596_000602 [Steinernema carpocapsae]|uniref:Uncharacterized protein n=1 Tax=Steinernema carpocapsae TaxID=34508 RepID=A0A4U8UJF9_STECR|nr:hypothetical protein L596_000602 [Steinernema carpocapsae]